MIPPVALMCYSRGMRRDDICLYLGPAEREQLEALLTDRNTPRKVAWRTEIVLATADGCGTNEIMRRADTSKPTVWRWQERYLDEGVAGLRRDKTRPSRVPPLPRETRLKVIAKPFTWTKTAEDILTRERRALDKLDEIRGNR